MSGISAIDCHMNNCAGLMAINVGDVQTLHQLGVAGGHLQPIHLGDNAVAAKLLYIADPAAVKLPAAGPLQAFTDWVG